jgi:hypothetical protein
MDAILALDGILHDINMHSDKISSAVSGSREVMLPAQASNRSCFALLYFVVPGMATLCACEYECEKFSSKATRTLVIFSIFPLR